MSERRFAVGQVVKMKSGGPLMTIIGLCSFDAQKYTVQWFKGGVHESTVHEEAIELRL